MEFGKNYHEHLVAKLIPNICKPLEWVTANRNLKMEFNAFLQMTWGASGFQHNIQRVKL